ncbi:MAG: efflux RND transporter periplasmic adaptor subunit, partial [Holophagales bacterium]|nr:efflux RND transporter periplasmic adaptor subunit [Holophagales bacterium]
MKPRSLLPFAAGVLLAAAISCNLTDARESGPGDSVESLQAARDAGGARSEGAVANLAASPSGAGDAIPVEVVRLESEELEEELFTTGELRANEQMEMRSEEDGRIVGLYFEEGKRVQEGNLLVKINDADLRAARERVRVQKRLAEQREQRSAALLAENTISQQIYDEALGELEVLAAQEAELEARIEKTEIRAPFSGVVGLREVSQGAYITSSQTIATLQSLDPIKVDFSIPEKYAGRVGRGDVLEFTVS